MPPDRQTGRHFLFHFFKEDFFHENPFPTPAQHGTGAEYAADLPARFGFRRRSPLPYEGSQTLDNNNTCKADGNTYTYELNTVDKTATLTKFTGKDGSTEIDAYVPKKVTQDDKTYYTVTTIGKEAFANSDNTHKPNTALKSVFLPDSIETIEEYAFYGCSSLSKITLYEGLTKVEIFAFCFTSLETIDWPKSLTTVGAMAFHNMTDYSQGNSAPSPKPIKTITYHGTKVQWDEMANDQGFATTNPQLLDATLHYAPTVTFDKNGLGDSEEKVVEYNHTTTPPANPTAEGFTFKGWYTAPEGGEPFDFTAEITEDKTAYAQWEKKTTPENPDKPTTPEQPPESTDKPGDNKPGTQQPGTTTPEQPTPPENTDKPTDKPNEPTTPDVPAVEEDDTAAIGYAAAAVTAAFVGWGAYRIGSEVYLKYLLPKDVLLPQNRIQLAELLWEDAGRPAPADAAPYTDVDANDADARQAARWAVENGLLTLPDTEKPEEFAPYRSVSYAKSARAWNKAQQLKENAAAR